MLVWMLACSDDVEGDSSTASEDTHLPAHDTGASTDTGPAPASVDWDPACNPLSVGNDCLTPYPSLHWFDRDETSITGLRLALDNDRFWSPDGELPLDLSIFNLADGVSPVSPVLINLGVDVDPAFLSGWGEQAATVADGAAIALVHVETGERVPLHVEMDQANRDQAAYDERHALILRPLAPMAFGARYFVVLTTELTDVSGNPLPGSPVFEAYRDGVVTDDEAIEAQRPAHEAMFEALDGFGFPRDGLHLAWEVPVASEDFALGPIRSMKEQTLADVAANGVSYTLDSVEVDPDADIAWRVKGTFAPPNFLGDDNRLVFGDDGAPVLQESRPTYPFTLSVPAVARERGGLSLLLVGHGLFGTGEGMLTGSAAGYFAPAANELGLVQVATDWIGLSGSDYTLLVNEILAELEGVRVVTDRLAQSHVNNLALVELVLSDLMADATFTVDHSEPLMSDGPVNYYGISLGGIQGASQVSLSPRIERAVLAVPGAGWAHMIQRSTQFEPLELVIDALYPDPLSQLLFISAMQSFFDWSDPAVLGALIDDGSPKVVILQEAIGDCQVPNLATDLLSRRLGARHLEDATDPVYGLDTVSGPAEGVVLTQVRVPDALESYFPPDENTTPETDNGVHNSAVLQEPTLMQAAHLYETGEAVHPCDGACDPD